MTDTQQEKLRASEVLAAAARINRARGELEEALKAGEALEDGEVSDLVGRYTSALYDGVTVFQRPMWGPDYVNPDLDRHTH